MLTVFSRSPRTSNVRYRLLFCCWFDLFASFITILSGSPSSSHASPGFPFANAECEENGDILEDDVRWDVSSGGTVDGDVDEL